MSIRVLRMALLLVCVFAVVASAATIDGKWVVQMQGRDGQTRETVYNFKADGDKLTGTVSGRGGDTPISDGKISGDEISFTVVRSFNGNEFKMNYRGKVSGDEIKLTTEGRGGRGPQEMTAKRAK